MTFHSFGVDQTGTELWTWREAQPAKEFLENNRDHIKAMAEKYNIDTLVLANVLYQERRHMDPLDWHQNANADKNSTATLGPGQMTIRAFTDMVDQNRIELNPTQREQYDRDPREFARQFIVDTTNGIEATAALISAQLDRQQEWGKIPRIPRDDDPNTLSLGQFIYGAALYSKGGRTGDSEFDARGPTTEQIDFPKNNIFGIVDNGVAKVPHDEQIVFAFHYLPDTYEAMYGGTAPSTIGGYFNDRSILRQPDRRSSIDDAPSESIASIAADRNQPTATRGSVDAMTPAGNALAFGNPGELSRDSFDSIAAKLQAQAPNLGDPKIAEVAADLTSKSLAAGHTNPALTINEQGRVFAYDPKNLSAQTVFSDPSTLNTDSIAHNAAKTRELAQTQAIALAPDAQNPNQAPEPKSRGLG